MLGGTVFDTLPGLFIGIAIGQVRDVLRTAGGDMAQERVYPPCMRPSKPHSPNADPVRE
jgi:hypothetical protein